MAHLDVTTNMNVMNRGLQDQEMPFEGLLSTRLLTGQSLLAFCNVTFKKKSTSNFNREKKN